MRYGLLGLGLGALLLLTGCATTRNFDLAMNSWVGAPVENLYSSWGYPKHVLSLPGKNKLLVYGYSEHYYTPAQIEGSGRDTYITGGYWNNFNCTAQFEVHNRRIINFSYHGNNCAFTKNNMFNHFNPDKPLPKVS